MEISIPQLNEGLMLPPSLVDQQAKDHAGPVLLAASLFGGLDDLLGDDFAMRARNQGFVELARDTLLD